VAHGKVLHDLSHLYEHVEVLLDISNTSEGFEWVLHETLEFQDVVEGLLIEAFGGSLWEISLVERFVESSVPFFLQD
jgi:hypothetical protein